MNTGKYNIILIEDQQIHADYIVSILHLNVFDVKIFNTGKEAFDYLKNPEIFPDLILVDNILPDMEGIDIIEYFIEANYNYAFVILTGANSISLAVKAMKTGALDYILKSLNLQEELEFVIVKSIKIHRDRLHKKLLEQRLKEREAELFETIAAKEKLYSIIAHDLKSPFNTILGYTNLLIEHYKTYDNEKIERFLTLVNSTAGNTFILLENLLKWVNSQSGTVSIEYETLYLSSIISEVIIIVHSTAILKNISIKYEHIDACEVYADKNMLKTIILNLVSNAIKFTNSSGTISISSRSVENYTEISISDNGIGMDNETQKELFVLQSKFSKKGTSGERGSGFGLVLCKDFVEKHNGTIWVESEVGKGSHFIFTIPASK